MFRPHHILHPGISRVEPRRFSVGFLGRLCQYVFRLLGVVAIGGEDSRHVISQRQAQFPEYAEAIDMYMSCWEESLPGEMPGMYSLVQELKANPCNHIYGLSNWSMETFPQARAKFNVLQLIDDYVVSGDIGVVKPNPRIFHTLLDRYGLQAPQCLFIDDNPANVEGATQLGFHGILFKDADHLRQQLEQYLS